MPNHQTRRAPLPADYQYPTHGVDCDCPSCRNKVVADPPMWTFERLSGGVLVRVPTRQMLVAGMAYDPNTERLVRPLEPTADTPWAI